MNNWSKIRTFLDKIQDFGYLSIGNILGAAILSLFWIFLASLLGPESYGEISYLIAIANTVSVIAFLGAGQTITVYVAKGIRIENHHFVLKEHSTSFCKLKINKEINQKSDEICFLN